MTTLSPLEAALIMEEPLLAIQQILNDFERQTGRKALLRMGSNPDAPFNEVRLLLLVQQPDKAFETLEIKRHYVAATPGDLQVAVKVVGFIRDKQKEHGG